MVELKLDLNDFLKCYTNSISVLVNKLRLSRKRNNKLISVIKDLENENKLFRDEIKSLESSDDNLRNLLYNNTICNRFIEGDSNKYFYSIRYRIKYQYIIDCDFKYSEWFDEESTALKHFNNLMNVNSNFVIEKNYSKMDWYSDSLEDESYYNQ